MSVHLDHEAFRTYKTTTIREWDVIFNSKYVTFNHIQVAIKYIN
jgi:hypothetical protein